MPRTWAAYFLAMSTTGKSNGKGATVLPFQREAEEDARSFSKRWGGKVADHGYSKVPHMFFALQAELGLKSQHAMVLLHLLDHWWHLPGGLPWPSKKTLANRMSLGERQVQRLLTDLEDEGLITRCARYYESGGQKSNAYDMTGLVNRLKKLEPDFRKAREAKKARRARAERPARRRRAGSPSSAK